MTPLEEAAHRFAALGREGGPGPLAALRREAMDRFVAIGLPTPKLEAWKHTNLVSLAQVPFAPAPAPSRLARVEAGARALVFVDGWYVADLSTPPPGARSLRDARDCPELFVSLERAFTALNLASFADGALVEIPAGSAPQPLELIFIARAADPPTASSPLALIRVGAGSRVTVVERHVGAGVHFTNAVTQLDIGEDAAVDHVQIVDGAPGAFHVGLTAVRQARDSRLTSQALVLGGKLSRREVETVQHGEGAECVLDGLYVAGAGEHVDCQTTIDHTRPHGASRELYKGVLGDGSEGVFNGRIVIRADAQKTSASQTNKNLLLSERARVDTRPQLEIRANDVRCSHGATVGQLDPDALFYLRSRGLPERTTRRILTEAFVREILDRIAPAARPHAEAAVAARLDREAA